MKHFQHLLFTALQDPEPASLLVDFGAAQSQNKPLEEVEAFDPFDKYLSNLAAKRGLGAAEAPVSLPERGAFQSPIQKNPAENPFDTFGEAPSNPFHSFFNNDASADGGEVCIGLMMLKQTRCKTHRL